jgi:hypothetical protein
LPTVIDNHAIARWRLRSQQLVAPFASCAEDVVRSLLAVQAENPSQSEWAVAARTENPVMADLATLLDTGRVLRTHVLRPTWHFVSASDIGWLIALTGPRVQRVTGTQLRVQYGLDGRALAKACDLVVEEIRAGGQVTRQHLVARLVDRGVASGSSSPPGTLAMLLLAHVELDGLICSGVRANGEHTYALMADRVPAPRMLDRDEALAELALRYATSHGPVTERDLSYWATLPLGDVRRGFATARHQLENFEHDGRTFWHAPGERPPSVPGEPLGHLLQILDESYRGYQDSRWVVDAAGLLGRAREKSTGMGLVDGQLLTTMRRTVGAERVRFELEPYRVLSAAEKTALADAATRYGMFLGKAAEVVYLDG